MKKSICVLLMSVTGVLAAFTSNQGIAQTVNDFDLKKSITVVSREEGSGTRGAFIELFEIEAKSADGRKKDMTTKEAIIASQTNIMLTNVANDRYSIGYVSTGAMNKTVKAVKINGVNPTVENIKNGSYTIARPFNIATKGEPTGLTKDFIDYILSAQGQKVVSKNYIPTISKAKSYAGQKLSGKIVVAGSSSVTPVMEKLKEGYLAINPNARIEIQMSDSTAGMTSVIDGISHIGMASRSLKDKEKAQLKKIEIAIDGIAVVVNDKNPTSNLSKAQVKNIFTGKTTQWDELAQ